MRHPSSLAGGQPTAERIAMFGRKKIIQQTLVSEEWLLNRNQSPFTTDIMWLQMQATHRLFICDNIMADRKQNFLLDDCAARLNVACFTKECYNYRIFKDGTPVPIEDSKGHRIMGEMVAATPDAFLKLDKLRQNGVQFIRKHVSVLLPNCPQDNRMLPQFLGKGRVDTWKCWMYVGIPDYWENTACKWEAPWQVFSSVPVFTPKERHQSWLTPYYKYQNEDFRK